MKHASVVIYLLAACLVLATSSNAITILSGPTFTPANSAPLAGTLQLTTDVASRISIQVSDGSNSWVRGFFDYTNNHSVTLLGFKAGRTNQIVVTVHDRMRNTYTATQALNFVTTNLPANFSKSVVWTSIPSRMEPGYTLFLISGVGHYMTMVDNSGQVVWYSPASSASYDLRQLSDGNLFTETSILEEINMLGQVVRTWAPPSGYPVNVHEGDPTAHGTILYLSDVSRSVTNFPATVVTNPVLHTVNVDDNPVVEISATNGALLNAWSPITLLNNPTRVTYLTYEFGTPFGVDNIHANAVIESTNDNCLIESLRDQNCVYKFSRDTGQLKWVLGSPDNWNANVQPYLLTPVGTRFEWNWAQHAPELTPQGTLLLFNNGNDRANPFNPIIWGDQTNFSCAVEYSINETNMTVSQVWDSSAAGTNFFVSQVMGKAQWLPVQTNVLVTYSYITYVNGVHPSPYAPNAMMARFVEMTHDPVPQIVFDLAFFDYTNTSPSYAGEYCYRAYRVPDLYAHPVLPVTDLALSLSNSTALLRFSGDPARTNSIQASTDLVNWSTLPTPVPNAIGEYDFLDPNSGQKGTRFYRVLTQ
jgi:arylsulfate sulfotransferase